MTSLAGAFESYVKAVVGGTAVPEGFRMAQGDDAISPYAALRLATPIMDLRQRGTFFTGAALAESTWRHALATLSPSSTVVDPACGAGDLLIPALSRAASHGLAGMTIRGCDLDASFANLTVTRLSAMSDRHPVNVEAFQRDFLIDATTVGDATHVVLNPPFISVESMADWGQGKVNAAAVFVERALLHMQKGARLIAILPDVLRSGTRYEAWRETVSSLGSIDAVEPLGQFDESTDVHVFVLHMTAGQVASGRAWISSLTSERTLDNLFDIRVGAVVPHRHAEEGDNVPYITARSLSSGQNLTRRFKGRLEHGPMVLINRTSRPGEIPRARARLWESSIPAAVENHLIIAIPKSRDLAECLELLQVLGDSRTADFLDDRIRCRHLTTNAVKEIPWLT